MKTQDILNRIREIEKNFDIDAMEELLQSILPTTNKEVTEELMNVIRTWSYDLEEGYAYNQFKVEDRPSVLENLIFCTDLALKVNSTEELALQKAYWYLELAMIQEVQSDKQKNLKHAYDQIHKVMDSYPKMDRHEILLANILIAHSEIDPQYRKSELESLLEVFIRTTTRSNYTSRASFFVSDVLRDENGKHRSAHLRKYFEDFVGKSEELFVDYPELRISLAFELIDRGSNDPQEVFDSARPYLDVIVQSSIIDGSKSEALCRALMSLSKGFNKGSSQRSACLEYADQIFRALNKNYPDEVEYSIGWIRLMDMRLCNEMAVDGNLELINPLFDLMFVLIKHVHRKWRKSDSFIADLLKKYNAQLFDNQRSDLNALAIQAYTSSIESSRMISLDFGTEVFSFSTYDFNNLAECYLINGDLDHAWETVKKHASLLKEQSIRYKYPQFDIAKLLNKPEFAPLHEKIQSLVDS